MANVLLNVKIDQESVINQMKSTELEMNKKLVKETKSLDITTRKFQLESRINKLYQDRLRIMNQLEQKESSLLQKGLAYTRLGVNQAQMGNVANQYGNVLQQMGGGIGSSVVAGAVGASLGGGRSGKSRDLMSELLISRGYAVSKETPLRQRIWSAIYPEKEAARKQQLRHTASKFIRKGVQAENIIAERLNEEAKERNAEAAKEYLADMQKYAYAQHGIVKGFGAQADYPGMAKPTLPAPIPMTALTKLPDIEPAPSAIPSLYRSLYNRGGSALSGILGRRSLGIGIGALGYSAFDKANSITEGARGLGLSAENYQRMSFAAERSGMGNIEGAYGAFKGARAAALGGDQGAQLAFKGLGISAGGDPIQEFQKLMATIKSGSGDANKMRSALTIFGEETDRIVANADKFSELSSITSQWSDQTVASLKYISDSFKTTMGEMAAGVGILASVAAPFIKIFNAGKTAIATTAAFAGALVGGGAKGTPEQALDIAMQQRQESQNKYAPSTTPINTPSDAARSAGLALPLIDYRSNVSLNRMQSQGLFVGGAPILGYQRESGITILKQIATNTAKTAEGMK
jgi:hypothetical protein